MIFSRIKIKFITNNFNNYNNLNFWKNFFHKNIEKKLNKNYNKILNKKYKNKFKNFKKTNFIIEKNIDKINKYIKIYKKNLLIKNVFKPTVKTFKFLKNIKKNLPAKNKIIEIGVGSGVITIYILNYLSNIKITSTDISEKSIITSKKNILFFFKKKIKNLIIKKKNLIKNTKKILYNYIISNPPYISIKNKYIKSLNIKFNPIESLTDFKNGIRFLKIIIKNSNKFLIDLGYIIIEFNINQLIYLKIIIIFYNFNTKIIEYYKTYNIIIIKYKKFNA